MKQPNKDSSKSSPVAHVLFDQDARHAMKRELLLKTAAGCFNEMGYSGTSLKEVGRRLGLTDAALYYYVRSKEELAFQCYERGLGLSERALARAIKEGGNGLKQLELFIRHQLEAIIGEDGPVAVLADLPVMRDEYRTAIYSRAKKQTRQIESVIAAGVEDGSIAPHNARLVGHLFAGAFNWIPKWYKPDGQFSFDEICESFTQSLLLGMKPR
jgi:TetR/AcrR family transcriptional regulator, cholesterol catabolism regulator